MESIPEPTLSRSTNKTEQSEVDTNLAIASLHSNVDIAFCSSVEVDWPSNNIAGQIIAK